MNCSYLWSVWLFGLIDLHAFAFISRLSWILSTQMVWQCQLCFWRRDVSWVCCVFSLGWICLYPRHASQGQGTVQSGQVFVKWIMDSARGECTPLETGTWCYCITVLEEHSWVLRKYLLNEWMNEQESSLSDHKFWVYISESKEFFPIFIYLFGCAAS